MPQQWVSFEEVKSQVSIREVLAHYALMQSAAEKPSKRGLELRLRCPFHEDNTPSLSINAATGKFLWSAKTVTAQPLTAIIANDGHTVLTINPTTLGGKPTPNKMVALDAKMTFDDNGLFRHTDLRGLRLVPSAGK